MKSIKFHKSAQNGRFYTYQFKGIYQDEPTYLDSLAQISIMFNMLLMCKSFKAHISDTNITGYTDKYGNKIIRYE